MPCLGSSSLHLRDVEQPAASEPQCSQSATPTPSTSGLSAALPLVLPAGFAEALLKTGTFLTGVLSKLRSAVASVFPQIDNITAQVRAGPSLF